MQKFVVFHAAPIAAIERIAAKKIERAGDCAPAAFAQDQQDSLSHVLANEAEEVACQIRSSPFSLAGIDIEIVEHVPVRFLEVTAGEQFDGDAVAARLAAFAINKFALSRGERGREVSEIMIALVAPVKLLVGAQQKTHLPGALPLPPCQKSELE